MPPKDQDPKDPAAKPSANPVDPRSFLLPKKEVPGTTTKSAQRINAGALFAQEQAAAGAGLDAAPPKPEPAPADPAAQTPPAPVVEKKEEDTVRPLQTYKGDIESLVSQGGISEVSIAAAEAVRKDKAREDGQATPAPVPQEKSSWLLWAYVVGGALLALTALGLVLFITLRPNTVPVGQSGAHAAIIFVDEVSVLPVAPPRHEAMAALVAARDTVDLALGLVERLYVTPAAATNVSAGGQDPLPYPIQDLLALFGPNIPVELLRTLKPEYLLGVHSYDSNQPFLILKPDSYDVAYKGMLTWEVSMRADLSPLFNRVPPVRLKPLSQAPAPVATTTATSTATTTPAPEPVTSVINTGFVDKIVDNRDTRVVETPEGDIVLLWTFVDRGTLLIATNEVTMREVVSRMANTPIISLPQ